MDAHKEPAYCYVKSWFFLSGGFSRQKLRQCGTAEAEFMGNKGWFRCQTINMLRFLEKHPQYEIEAFLLKEATGERFRLGRINRNENSFGILGRSFSDAGLKVEKSSKGKNAYTVMVIASEISGDGRGGSTVLFESRFVVPYELRDERVVDFKKEAIVEKTVNQQYNKKNPLFKMVEPFQPPIPNSVWWQISIQPVFDYGYLQQDYCPRKKSNKAVF